MKYTHPSIVKAVLETLEDRRMLSTTTFEDGVLNIAGNVASNNRVALRLSADSSTVKVSVNHSNTDVPVSQLNEIRIVGGERTDVIEIDPSIGVNAHINTGGGNDWIFAGGGNDVIDSGAGNDFVDGRNGNDYINTAEGNDRVYGGDGNDTVDADGGNDTVLAGRGDDLIYGGDGNDHLDGKEGNDSIYAGQGDDRAFGDDGDDLIDGKEGSDTISGGAGADIFVAPDSSDAITDSEPSDSSTSVISSPDNNTGGGDTAKPTDNTTGGSTNNGGADHTNTGGGSTGGGTTDSGSDTNTDNNTGGGSTGGNTSGGGTGSTGWDTSDDNTGQAGAPNPVISILNADGMAGHAVHVNALKSSFGSGSAVDAKYEWNFGDDAGEHNILAGFNAAHVYDKAGTYTITLKITNKAGKVAYETAKVNISADARRTIYVDAQGNDANSGTSAGAAVKTWERAKQLADDNTKILFERGDTFVVNSTMTLDGSNIIVGAYGSGNRPVLSWNGSDGGTLIGMSGNAQNIVIQDLTFASSGSNAAMAVKPQGTNITIRNNEFVSAYYGINNNGKPTGVLVEDNLVTKANGIKSYFVWVAGTDIVIVGNHVTSTGESNIRMSQYERVLVANNELRDDDKATVIAQKGSYVYVANNDITNGNMGAGPLGMGDGLKQDPDYKTVRTSWVVFEGNHTHNTNINVLHGAEHVMIRNNIVEKDKGAAFSIDGYNSQYERSVADVQLIGNTAINNDTTGNFLKTWSGNSGLVVKNNLYVAPNLVTGASNSAAMYILASDLNGFVEISGNIWPSVTALTYANGGTHYLWSNWSNSEGYLDAREWEALSQVHGDVYQDVTLNFAASATVSGVTAGATMPLAA